MAICKDCIHYEVCECEDILIRVPEWVNKVEDYCGCFKPKADYVEVKYGKWIMSPHQTISKIGRVINVTTNQCSVCGRWNGRSKPNFCPKCGANMKGGAE